MTTMHKHLGWNPDAVMPPGENAIDRYYASKGHRKLSPKFWISFWLVACSVLTLVEWASKG